MKKGLYYWLGLLAVVILFSIALITFKPSLWISCPIGGLIGWYYADIYEWAIKKLS